MKELLTNSRADLGLAMTTDRTNMKSKQIIEWK